MDMKKKSLEGSAPPKQYKTNCPFKICFVELDYSDVILTE